ncbi:MAG: CYCXC family (seleno)protein [Thermodesulfobacteriota bacterium]
MKKSRQGGGSKRFIVIGTVILVILVFGGGYILSEYNREQKVIDISELRGGETRETMSPVFFTGRVAKAYRIAREIPEVIDSLYCYCRCKENYGHKSLLTCFVDEHGASCDVCMEEAVMAYNMYNKGKEIVSIRKAIDRRFSS